MTVGRPYELLIALGIALPATTALRGQAAPSAVIVPLPVTGAHCTVRDAGNDLKRDGTWQMAEIRVSGSLDVVLALDAKQRPVTLMEMGAGVHGMVSIRLDSTGAVQDPVSTGPRNDAALRAAGRGPLSAEDKMRARQLAADALRRCAPLPKIVGLGQPIPPFPHTTVLADIPADRPRKCAATLVGRAAAARGVRNRLVLTTEQPPRMLAVDVDSAGHPRSLSAMVSWGAARPFERETAEVQFDARGAVSKSSKFLGYGGPDGRGETVSLTTADNAAARALAAEVLKRCA